MAISVDDIAMYHVSCGQIWMSNSTHMHRMIQGSRGLGAIGPTAALVYSFVATAAACAAQQPVVQGNSKRRNRGRPGWPGAVMMAGRLAASWYSFGIIWVKNVGLPGHTADKCREFILDYSYDSYME